MEKDKVKKTVFSEKGLLLKKVNVNGYICGDFVEFSISQLYENRSDEDIDAIYTFPLPETAVITGFETVIGGRTLKAIVEEKNDAIRIFNEAVNNDSDTFIMEQLEEDMFQISLGTMLPNEIVKVKITYIDQLIFEDDNYKLIIPSIERAKFVGEKAEIYSCPEVPYKLYMSLFVESMGKMEFSSLSHGINIEREDDTLSKITLKSKNESLDSDFILILKDTNAPEAGGMSYKYVDDDGEKGILYLRLFPKLEVDDENGIQNYNFIIDVSNSMEGYKFEEEKNGLQLCIRNLNEGDYFNIIAFGKQLKNFSENGKVTFNEVNLKKATDWINELTIERGANIYEALRYALQEKNEEGISRIILFTNDDVDEEEDVILNYVKTNIGNNRIFPIGIDTSVNSYFINKLAEYGYGKAEFVYPGERIDDMVLRQFNRITNPQVDVIGINWGSMDVEATYPRTIEYLYDREPFSIFAKVKGEIGGKITIKGKVGEEEYIKVIDIDKLDLEENASLIQKVWSRKRIESIEEKMRNERGQVAESMRRKVINISKESGIISPETTFLMLEEIEEPVLGMTINRIIPINISEETMKNISEGYFLDTPSFSVKSDIREKKAEKKVDLSTALNYLKYDTENLLRILARNQNSDGAFSIEDAVTYDNRIESTLISLLAFALSKENINIYVDQINKAVSFIIRDFENNKAMYDEKLCILTLLTLFCYESKGIMRRKNKADINEANKKLLEIVKEKKYIGVENVIATGDLNIIRQFSAIIVGVTSEFSSLDKEILEGDPKSSIVKIAMLVISKTL